MPRLFACAAERQFALEMTVDFGIMKIGYFEKYFVESISRRRKENPMKKLILILCIAALILSLTACTVSVPISHPDFMQHRIAAWRDTQEPSAPAETPPATEPLFVAPPLSDCVGLYSECAVDYSDGYNDWYAVYQLPEILLNSSDAKRANSLIRSTFEPLIDQCVQAELEKTSLICTGISYECWIFDQYLSVLIHEENDWSCDSYLAFTFDLTDGSWLGNREYADYLGVSEDALFAQIRSSLLYHFDAAYADLPEEYQDDFFFTQRERQYSDENVNATELFLDRDGSVQMICLLYSMAGADAYSHVLPLVTD